jgi:hypothetical protein
MRQTLDKGTHCIQKWHIQEYNKILLYKDRKWNNVLAIYNHTLTVCGVSVNECGAISSLSIFGDPAAFVILASISGESSPTSLDFD